MVTRLPEAGLERARRLGRATAVERRAVRCWRPSRGIMEDERSFSDICGGRLALQRRYYSPSCREFCLSCPRLSLRSLTAVTCTVWLAAYGLFTLCEVRASRPLPAVEGGGSALGGSLGSLVEPGPLVGPSYNDRTEGRELTGSGDDIPLLDSSLNDV